MHIMTLTNVCSHQVVNVKHKAVKQVGNIELITEKQVQCVSVFVCVCVSLCVHTCRLMGMGLSVYHCICLYLVTHIRTSLVSTFCICRYGLV